MHRRNFLGVLSAAAAGFSAPSAFSAASTWAREPISRSGPPRFDIALSAYSLRDYFRYQKAKTRQPAGDGPAIDMFGFLDYCVAQRCDAAELTSYFFRPDADEQYFRDLKHAAFVRGMTISGTAIGNNFTVGKGPRLEAEIESAIRWIERAAVLGAPHIRFFAGTGRQLEENPARLTEATDAINRCAEHAARHGIFLGIENHGNLSADQMLAIMQRVESPWVGINLDTGNFHSEDPYRDLARCVGYAVNVQVKAHVRPSGGQREPADLKRIGKILRDAGYQGFVALEYEDDQPYEHIPRVLRELEEALRVG